MADNIGVVQRGSYAYTGNNQSPMKSNLELTDGMAHGMFNLAKNPSLYEIQRQNTFEFQVYGLDDLDVLPPSTAAGQSVIQDYAFGNTEEVIRLSVSSFTPPSYSQDEVSVKRGNTTIYFAGTPTYEGGDIELNDYIGAGTLEALMKWQNMSFNPETEKVGLAMDYKKYCTLTEYTPTFQIVRRWKLYGCWLKSLKQGQFSYDNGDKQKISATIRYDYALLDLLADNK